MFIYLHILTESLIFKNYNNYFIKMFLLSLERKNMSTQKYTQKCSKSYNLSLCYLIYTFRLMLSIFKL